MLIGVDVSRALRSQRTGTERYAWEIIHHLLLQPAAAQHTWRLYTDLLPAESPFALRTPGAAAGNVHLCLLPPRPMWTHRALAGEVLRRPPDVLFVPAHVIPFVLPPQRLPPAVVTIHDLGYRYFPQAHTRRQRLYLDASTRWSAQVARRVIAISQATAHDLQQSYGIDRRKIDVIYEATVPPPAHVSAPLPPHLQRPYALYIGTIQPRKNLVRLAQAYARLLAEQDAGWDLVLAGGAGWLSTEVISQLDALGLDERIHRLGYVADEDLETLLRHALFFCYVSLYEGFGLPVLEAQARGVPVMTANNSSLPEVAGSAALLVDPLDAGAIADAMLRLSSDETLRQALIAAGHANVARFSWDKAARETLDVLLAAAQERR